MHTGRTTTNGRNRGDDTGFTLVELLIVIVILGILATVTVFAVRGITDSGQENAEATDLRALQQATEAYTAQVGGNPTEQQLVDGGFMSELSELHDVAVDGAGVMTITNVRTGAVVETLAAPGAGGGGGGGGGGGAWSGPVGTIGAYTTASAGVGAIEAIIIGGAASQAAWNAEVDAGNIVEPTSGFTFYAIDTSEIADISDMQALVVAADAAGIADIYVTDDANSAAFCTESGTDYDKRTCVDVAAFFEGSFYTGQQLSAADFSSIFVTP